MVRPPTADLTLYQSLVDALAPSIESALADRNHVFAYRQSLNQGDDPFEDTPRWSDYILSTRAVLEAGSSPYVLVADIASYFVYVDTAELSRKLLVAGGTDAVVRDLSSLLNAWHTMGLRGIPQGVPPSSALGNFYLAELDDLLLSEGYDFRRYMDDIYIFADSYSDARRVQDLVEKYLYKWGLSLGSEKSRILRNETGLTETEMAKERIERRAEALAARKVGELLDPYSDEFIELDPSEIDAAAVVEEYWELATGIRQGKYPEKLRPRLIEVYRQLEAITDDIAVADVALVLQRFPDLTGPALRYVAKTASGSAESAVAAFLEILGDGRFHRDQELLLVYRACLWLPNRCSTALAEVLADHSCADRSWLLRSRALLAWGAQSDDLNFDAADRFWRDTEPDWRAYTLVAIQEKDRVGRDGRFDAWSGEGRFLRTLTEEIRKRPFQWRNL